MSSNIGTWDKATALADAETTWSSSSYKHNTLTTFRTCVGKPLTNAHQSCSKKLSCKQVIPSQMLVITNQQDDGCKMIRAAASLVALNN